MLQSRTTEQQYNSAQIELSVLVINTWNYLAMCKQMLS